MSFLDFFRARRSKREFVTITEEAIVRVSTDGTEKRVRWDDLQEVGIVTTDEGPMQDDVFWLFLSVDGNTGCAVPQGADGADKLLDWVQRKLPGLDNETVIQAMGSTSNARFTCWRRQTN